LSENRFHTGAHAGASALLDVFSPLHKTDSTHDVVAVFDTEDLTDFFRDGDSSSGYDFGKEGDVFLVDLYGQSERNVALLLANDITF
jgi:hypothetical protein